MVAQAARVERERSSQQEVPQLSYGVDDRSYESLGQAHASIDAALAPNEKGQFDPNQFDTRGQGADPQFWVSLNNLLRRQYAPLKENNTRAMTHLALVERLRELRNSGGQLSKEEGEEANTIVERLQADARKQLERIADAGSIGPGGSSPQERHRLHWGDVEKEYAEYLSKKEATSNARVDEMATAQAAAAEHDPSADAVRDARIVHDAEGADIPGDWQRDGNDPEYWNDVAAAIQNDPTFASEADRIGAHIKQIQTALARGQREDVVLSHVRALNAAIRRARKGSGSAEPTMKKEFRPGATRVLDTRGLSEHAAVADQRGVATADPLRDALRASGAGSTRRLQEAVANKKPFGPANPDLAGTQMLSAMDLFEAAQGGSKEVGDAPPTQEATPRTFIDARAALMNDLRIVMGPESNDTALHQVAMDVEAYGKYLAENPSMGTQDRERLRQDLADVVGTLDASAPAPGSYKAQVLEYAKHVLAQFGTGR